MLGWRWLTALLSASAEPATAGTTGAATKAATLALLPTTLIEAAAATMLLTITTGWHRSAITTLLGWSVAALLIAAEGRSPPFMTFALTCRMPFLLTSFRAWGNHGE